MFVNTLLLVVLASTGIAAQCYTNEITRDVCIIGGGASGTYTAIRLREQNQSVVVIEKEDRLGGHTQTYLDPTTQKTIDYGVVVYHDLPLVRDFFNHFSVALTPVTNLEGGTQAFFDFDTGLHVNYTAPDPATALLTYATQLAKYPYLNDGFFLPDDIPDDLLLPFGDFVDKYNMTAALPTIFDFTQGLGNILTKPTIYVMKNFGADVLGDAQTAFLTTPDTNNSALYAAATVALGADAMLSTLVVSTDRTAPGAIKILVKDTTTGCFTRITASKLVLAIPQLLYNLAGFDLDEHEQDVLGQFTYSGYYTGLLRNSGLPDTTITVNASPDMPENVAHLPGVYSFWPSGVAGLQDVKYGSPVALSDTFVQDDIQATLDKLRNAGLNTSPNAEWAVFSSHTPFELAVGPDAIRAGFYKDLYGLQGRHGTFYTGAALHTQDSAMVWNFTEHHVLPLLLQ